MHPCERCGEPIQDQYRLCYVCMTDERKALGSRFNARTGYTTSYVASGGNIAPNAQETRQKAIQEAHDENIIATMKLVEAIEHLTGAIRLMGEKGAK